MERGNRKFLNRGFGFGLTSGIQPSFSYLAVFQIVSAVIMDALFAFVRVSVAVILHEGGGRHKLLWCGGVTQAGSFAGALIAFLLVSFFGVFHSGDVCSSS